MSQHIIKKINKDIDQLYLNQKENIKDLCHIQRRKNSILRPALFFVIVSLMLCFQIYQIQPKTPITTHETELKKTEKESVIKDKKLSQPINQNQELTQTNDYQYNYILGGIGILIIFYIFLKKTNKI